MKTISMAEARAKLAFNSNQTVFDTNHWADKRDGKL